MPNYMTILGEHYPNVSAICSGDPTVYAQVEWHSGDPLPSQAELDAVDLLDYKAAAIEGLGAACRAEIVNGFPSYALGTEHWYDSAEADQLNLIGSVAAGDDMLYPCRTPVEPAGTKNYVQHTHAQLLTIIKDGRDIKTGKLQTFATAKAQILDEATNTTAAVDAIVTGVTW